MDESKTTEMNKYVVDYVKQTTRQEDIDDIKQLLQSTIQDDWVKNVSHMNFYIEEDYHISDIMIFGKDKDKVLIFVWALYSDSDNGRVKLLTGQYYDDKWNFEFSGKPNFYYEYREDLRNGVKFTGDELLALTINKLADDGLVTFWGDLSQEYIANKWFY